jgi:hypothetical protein
VNLPFKPAMSPREQAIARILVDVLGPDPAVPAETPVHYDVDASFLASMLDANPSEEHVVEYFIADANIDDFQRRLIARRLLALLPDR